MVPLRRLPDRAAPVVALLLIATSELMVGLAMSGNGRRRRCCRRCC